mgnify:FL=1
MDLTREFLEKVEEMVQPQTLTEGIRTFVDKPMHMLVDEIAADTPLRTNSLSSVADYIKSNADFDALASDGRKIIHVEDEKTVWLYTEMNSFKKRSALLLASAWVSSFPFGQWLSLENFIISVQANFVTDEHRDELLSFVATVKQDTGVEQQDDGVTQKVTTRSGVSLSRTSKVPNPITLRPFRTFSEVEQPESAFVFRIKAEEGCGVKAALFAADGDAWRHDAILKIRDYFQTHVIAEDDSVIVLA